MPQNAFYFDWPFLAVLAAALLGMLAQQSVRSTYKKYAAVLSQSGITAAQAARGLLDSANLQEVSIELAQGGTLSDHYDPRKKVLRLSPDVYNSSSVAALGIAAHEAGHAMQHGDAYMPIRIRNAIVPVVQFASSLSMPLFLVGLFLSIGELAIAGVILYALAVVFQLITLPVELNASSRAMAALEAQGYLYGEELTGARKVLTAAASTYIAAALVSIAQLIRLAGIANRRR